MYPPLGFFNCCAESFELPIGAVRTHVNGNVLFQDRVSTFVAPVFAAARTALPGDCRAGSPKLGDR
jgi:hypothetical protein